MIPHIVFLYRDLGAPGQVSSSHVVSVIHFPPSYRILAITILSYVSIVLANSSSVGSLFWNMISNPIPLTHAHSSFLTSSLYLDFGMVSIFWPLVAWSVLSVRSSIAMMAISDHGVRVCRYILSCQIVEVSVSLLRIVYNTVLSVVR
jgi:hypothetical protein